MNSINLNAKILYDKSGIIITDLDLNNYINLSTQLDQIKLDKNKAIKNLVLQKKIIKNKINIKVYFLLNSSIVSNKFFN